MGFLIIYISSRPDMMKNRVSQWLRQHNFPQGLCFFQKGIHHDPYARKVTLVLNSYIGIPIVAKLIFFVGGNAKKIND